MFQNKNLFRKLIPGFRKKFNKYFFCIVFPSKSKFIKVVDTDPIIQNKKIKKYNLYIIKIYLYVKKLKKKSN